MASRCCRRREPRRQSFGGALSVIGDTHAREAFFSRRRSEFAQHRKTTHWIWFIIREEALAYLEHPILGPRLLECTLLISRCKDAAIGDILPHPDDLKFHSSMTLFQAVSGQQEFADTLNRLFGAH